jgi:hypothetical protein
MSEARTAKDTKQSRHYRRERAKMASLEKFVDTVDAALVEYRATLAKQRAEMEQASRS